MYTDTERRYDLLRRRGIWFVGSGVSGGEEGALKGPSLMPGGAVEAWPTIQPIFESIAAKVGPQHDVPCCTWIGPGGSGHYVKMVHNGIEYGDMQLICEAYWLLKHIGQRSNSQLADIFDSWNRGELDSYLIEITRDIFTVTDEESSDDLVDRILDRAGAKGTGKWMSQLALDLGVPSTLVTEAVFARALSAARRLASARASNCAGRPSRCRGTWHTSRSWYVRRCTPQKSAAMRRDSCSSQRRRPNMVGHCNLGNVPESGEEAALFVLHFWIESRRRTIGSRSWRTYCSTPTFAT